MPLTPLTLLRIGSLAGASCVAVTLFSGCASTATVKIDAAANPAASDGYAYALSTRDPGRTNDVRYGAVIAHVHTALTSRGMYEAPDPAKADVIIDVDYGEHPPQTKVTTVSQPVMISPSSTMGPYPSGSGSSYPGSYPGSPSSYPGTNIDPITGQPRSSVVMVQSQRVTYTTEKYIRIRASENPKLKRHGDPAAQQVWAVEATLEDESTDFEVALPSMIDAAIEYIGQNTGGQVTVKVQVPPA